MANLETALLDFNTQTNRLHASLEDMVSSTTEALELAKTSLDALTAIQDTHIGAPLDRQVLAHSMVTVSRQIAQIGQHAALPFMQYAEVHEMVKARDPQATPRLIEITGQINAAITQIADQKPHITHLKDLSQALITTALKPA